MFALNVHAAHGTNKQTSTLHEPFRGRGFKEAPMSSCFRLTGQRTESLPSPWGLLPEVLAMLKVPWTEQFYFLPATVCPSLPFPLLPKHFSVSPTFTEVTVNTHLLSASFQVRWWCWIGHRDTMMCLQVGRWARLTSHPAGSGWPFQGFS